MSEFRVGDRVRYRKTYGLGTREYIVTAVGDSKLLFKYSGLDAAGGEYSERKICFELVPDVLPEKGEAWKSGWGEPTRILLVGEEYVVYTYDKPRADAGTPYVRRLNRFLVDFDKA